MHSNTNDYDKFKNNFHMENVASYYLFKISSNVNKELIVNKSVYIYEISYKYDKLIKTISHGKYCFTCTSTFIKCSQTVNSKQTADCAFTK